MSKAVKKMTDEKKSRVKYHVHVYRVIDMAEIDLEIEADTHALDPHEIAMENALKRAKSNKLEFGKADCKFIAVPFLINSK